MKMYGRVFISQAAIMNMLFLLVLFLCNVNFTEQSRARFREEKKCEKIKVPICKGIGYNLTHMPNRFGHKTQIDAGLVIHQFWPLVSINCSPHLKHFVCSLYAPMCDPEFRKEVLPCRSFCEEVRDACEPIMQQNQFSWPNHLSCSNFPTREQDPVCMKPDTTIPATSPPKTKESAEATPHNPWIDRRPEVPRKNQNKVRHNKAKHPIPNVKVQTVSKDVWLGGTSCGCWCQAPFVYPNKSMSSEELPPCVLRCEQYFFSQDERDFVNFWLGLWSILTLISTTLACATFLVDRGRFSYTERPVFWMAFCYFMVAIGYVIRLIYGFRAIGCNQDTDLIRYSATGPAPCTAVFMLTYFFGNVAWIWWVVLCMNWFLAAGLKWSTEAITSYSQYFHFVAWLIPTVQTMAILAMAAIDTDPVSGMCYVGNHDKDTLTIFVIAPLLIYCVLGLSFLLAGVVGMIHYKRVIRINGGYCQKLDSLLSRIGIFSAAFLIPAVVVIVCHFYEHNNREDWEKSTNCPCMAEKRKPKFYMYLTKYLMSLAAGVVIGLWVVNSNTLASWKYIVLRKGSKNGSSNSRSNNNFNQQKRYDTPVHL